MTFIVWVDDDGQWWLVFDTEAGKMRVKAELWPEHVPLPEGAFKE